MSVSGMLGYGASESTSRGRGTTIIQSAVPGRSPEEIRLMDLQSQLAEINLRAAQGAEKEQADRAASPLAKQQQELEAKATANLLARVTGQAPVLSPEEQGYLDTIYGTAQGQGERDIRRFAESLAASRGFTLADAPIGNEALRQQGQLTQSLQGQKAASALNLGTAAADFNARLVAFQDQLRQQAMMNRLNLAGLQGGMTAFGSQLLGERLGQKSTFQRSTGLQNVFGWNAQGDVGATYGFSPGGTGGAR